MAEAAPARMQSGAKVGDERRNISAAHVHVPADEHNVHQLRGVALRRLRSSVNRGAADTGTPGVNPRPLTWVAGGEPLHGRRSTGYLWRWREVGRDRSGAPV